MRRQGRVFNPFIVLCDVTIATLVVIASLLILFIAVAQNSAQAQRRQVEQARNIALRQEHLVAQARSQWPMHRYTLLYARGLQSYLCRFPGSEMFQAPPNQAKLSAGGEARLKLFARVWGPRLRQLQGTTAGSLIEIQVQGHCAPESCSGSIEHARRLSLERATACAEVLQNLGTAPEFPDYLISVSGYGWHRPAYYPSEWARARGWSMKRKIADRIDILLMFAGDNNASNYVRAWDGDQYYGPLNDVSTPKVRPAMER